MRGHAHELGLLLVRDTQPIVRCGRGRECVGHFAKGLLAADFEDQAEAKHESDEPEVTGRIDQWPPGLIIENRQSNLREVEGHDAGRRRE